MGVRKKYKKVGWSNRGLSMEGCSNLLHTMILRGWKGDLGALEGPKFEGGPQTLPCLKFVISFSETNGVFYVPPLNHFLLKFIARYLPLNHCFLWCWNLEVEILYFNEQNASKFVFESHVGMTQLKLVNSVFSMVRRIKSMLLKGERV